MQGGQFAPRVGDACSLEGIASAIAERAARLFIRELMIGFAPERANHTRRREATGKFRLIDVRLNLALVIELYYAQVASA